MERWLSTFRVLHEKARQGTLAGLELREYRARRAELERAMLAAQRLMAPPGGLPRQALRVARALQVELRSAGGRDRVTTYDISVGGLSAPMAEAPALGERLTATIRLPGGEVLVAIVKAVGATPQAGSIRVSFAFEGLGEVAAERLELAIVDMVLAQLKS